MTIDHREFRRVLGAFPTGVTIVTARHDNSPAGFTANAFTSVSLDPPLVLICVGNQNATLRTIQSSQAFAVNVMPIEEEALARCFATNGPAKYERFCDASWHVEATGSPVLDNTLAWVDCRLSASYPGGDHQIIVGEVLALGMRPGTPLLFSAGAYLPMPSKRE
jgi:3-hydroxy-9,10-secoandrosta-1,3,5(10)-triene-9,17-dione monooxygenase reductase component